MNLNTMHASSPRDALKEDCAGISACLQHAFMPYRDSYSDLAFADTVPTPEGVRQRMQAMKLFVVATGSVILGTIGCSWNGSEGHLRGMAVLPEVAGTGIALELLHTAEAHLRNVGCTTVTLDTTDPLKRAVRFYEKNGYRRSGRVTDFFGMSLHEFAKAL